MKDIGRFEQELLVVLLCLLVGMVGLGRWASYRIASEAVRHSALTTTMYVDRYLSPHLQDLSWSDRLTAGDSSQLEDLLWRLRRGSAHNRVVAFKVWDPHGQVVYSDEREIVGQVFPVESRLAIAWQGATSAEISNLRDAENVAERRLARQLIETYVPVRLSGTSRVIAVAEIYESIDTLATVIQDVTRQLAIFSSLIAILLTCLLGMRLAWTAKSL